VKVLIISQRVKHNNISLDWWILHEIIS